MRAITLKLNKYFRWTGVWIGLKFRNGRWTWAAGLYLLLKSVMQRLYTEMNMNCTVFIEEKRNTRIFHFVTFNRFGRYLYAHVIYEMSYPEERTTFRYWYPGQPGKEHWNCVYMQRQNGWLWYDYPCNDTYYHGYRLQYICQFGKMFEIFCTCTFLCKILLIERK